MKRINQHSGLVAIRSWLPAWLFFCSGFAYAVWGVSIPVIAQKFALNDLGISFAPFALASGTIMMMIPAGKLIAVYGSRQVCLLGAIFQALMLWSILKCQSYPWLLMVLWGFGVANACFDTAMNAQVIADEQFAGKSRLSAMHGLFSAGGMSAAYLTGLGLDPDHLSVMFQLASGLSLLAALLSYFMLSLTTAAQASISSAQSTDVDMQTLKLGWLAFLTLMAEGAIYDWSALFMRDEIGVASHLTGTAYLAFSSGMLLGRLAGDRLRIILGDRRLLRYSALIAASALAGLILHPALPWILLSFVLIGLGIANLIPILFNAAGQLNTSSGLGIARVSLMAYIGFLMEPVFMGAIATKTNLSDAFLLIISNLLLIALMSRWIKA